ncbi:autotransporter outer membrane beta-barrel domain-containing protein [Sphingomonas sp. Leaf21]|uniref:autotransporter outer membrane beta-barrel domain-containing protein n=1 Tax=Sphingomonas sp. Leaf21 TaxID=2876550 RepID=UPI001E64EF9D|nr:autotransporter domain-containing protein [Sphingomonas sp. Leaf21]
MRAFDFPRRIIRRNAGVFVAHRTIRYLSTVAFGLLATPALADTTVGSSTSTPLATSSAGNVTIASGGTITPNAAGAAVTIDSDASVSNAGSITSKDINNSIGIQANAGVTGGITNTGSITLSESYTRTDTNGDTVLDGPYAQGSGRYGIQTLGAFNGAITQGGTISVYGNNSAGIGLGGPLNGALTHSGTTAVYGDNSFGIVTGAVNGDVALGGSISAYGTGSSAVALNGAVSGAVNVTATMVTTGYSAITAPATLTSLTAQNLALGGPTLSIAGSVGGGVTIAAATSTTTNGTTVTTTAGTLSNYGSAPALQIGSASGATTIGAISGDSGGYSVAINGSATGSGVYAGNTANGVHIGGLGGTTALTGGMVVRGAVTAIANGASATAVWIGSGTTAPALDNSGAINASGAGSAGQSATGVLIDAGASVGSMTNSGTIAALTATGATGYGVRDLSGTLSSITNSGTIAANGGGTPIAIDLSANGGATTIVQNFPTTSDLAPAITGAILMGAGPDSLTINAGKVVGDVTFGGGSNAMALTGTATYAGTANFGGGASTLTMGGSTAFVGQLANAGNTAVTVTGGTLALTATGVTTIGSLNLTGGTLGVTVDGATGASTLLNVTGNATIGTGATIAVLATSLNNEVGSYTVLRAGTLNGAANLGLADLSLPYLFNGTIGTDATGTAVNVTVARKTAAQLGLTGPLATIYDPAYAAALGDAGVGDTFLSWSDASQVSAGLRQMLPDFAGGNFDSVSLSSRALNRILADPEMPVLHNNGYAGWLQQVAWADTKGTGDSAGYKVSGWGLTGGFERGLGGFGRIGVSLAYLIGVNDTVGNANAITSQEYKGGLYWRGQWGGLHAYATGTIGAIRFDGTRTFNGISDGIAFARTANSTAHGRTYDAAAGLSYQVDIGRLYLRPQASIDYVRLNENGYAETGGGTGFDLNLAGRTEQETGVNATLALGYNLRKPDLEDGSFLRLEVEGGDRALLNSRMDATTVSFAGGDAFTLTPEARKAGWLGNVRLKGGSNSFAVTVDLGEERQQDHTGVAGKMGLTLAL